MRYYFVVDSWRLDKNELILSHLQGKSDEERWGVTKAFHPKRLTVKMDNVYFRDRYA